MVCSRFGPLVDDATDACDEYNIDSALRTHNSKKRAHSRGEEPGAKRAKHTLSERKSFQFAEVKAMIKDLTSGTDPSLKVPSNEMPLTATLNAPSSTADIFDKIDILSILQPPTTDIEILTSPSLAVPFSFSHFSSFAQEHISEFMAGVSAFAQREVAEYHSAARGASIFSLPLAFIEGFISALATDTKRLATPISIPSPPSTSEPRLPPLSPLAGAVSAFSSSDHPAQNKLSFQPGRTGYKHKTQEIHLPLNYVLYTPNPRLIANMVPHAR
ncbi:hypothetical protein FB451DRAFT_134812 [Mycena latifolia]|nr:hypothetical protein FB451DRAFT_134812 [Mycena latifolia]